MKKCVRRTLAADNDLFDIWEYIANDNTRAANELLDTLEHKFLLLAENPLAGHVRADVPNELRCFPEGRLIIIYRPVTEGVEIIRVLHASRDFATIFGL